MIPFEYDFLGVIEKYKTRFEKLNHRHNIASVPALWCAKFRRCEIIFKTFSPISSLWRNEFLFSSYRRYHPSYYINDSSSSKVTHPSHPARHCLIGLLCVTPQRCLTRVATFSFMARHGSKTCQNARDKTNSGISYNAERVSRNI